ncbi:hypothetical protein AArcMg_1478 [Natrarchaeobaculum sulfurireducens]|uniref:Uncharacterized protein n=1 Tax=Natrarchaeobaculum sulfurireducens TaxID=2044521 RepID=A0A346PPP6_9EURY|nr:hypothetical protein AArcMg_1478 [Natrarchaeobaculum sulfurireducens]
MCYVCLSAFFCCRSCSFFFPSMMARWAWYSGRESSRAGSNGIPYSSQNNDCSRTRASQRRSG